MTKLNPCSTTPCRTCGKHKAPSEFYFHKASGRPRAHCKSCTNAQSRAYHKANPEKRRARYLRAKEADPETLQRKLRATNLRWRFGLTQNDYDAMFTQQGGCCAICGSGPKGKHLYIDHDHNTGAIRGLLCNYCNLGLGKFKDNPDTLRKAARYLDAQREAGTS
jgi:hypothetical protein